MFDKEYQTVEVIKTRKTKKTSIVMDSKGQYFIAKRIPIENAQTIHQIEMMKKIKHPNIVTIHQTIVQNDCVYIIEQYCEEGDLSFHMMRRNRIKRSYYPEETVAKWTLQMLLAIQYLHSHQIIHRDLRTQNIFLTAQGNIKLGAFKFSKIVQKQQGLGLAFALINSTYSSPPECLEKNGSNEKADIWAFGCIIQQICTLKPNNIVENAQKLKGKHQSLPAIYSSNLNEIYLSCLNINPNDRPTSQQILSNPYYMVHLKKFIKIQQTQESKKRKIPIKKYQVHKKNEQKHKLDHLKAFTLQKKISSNNNEEKGKLLKMNSREDGPYKIKIQAIKDLQSNDRNIMRKYSIQTRKDRQKLPQIKHNRAKSRQVTKRDSLERQQNFMKNQSVKQIQSQSNLPNQEIKLEQKTLVENSLKISKQLVSKSSIEVPNRMLPPPIPKPPRKKSMSSQTSSDSKKMSDSCTSSPKKQQQYKDDKMKSDQKDTYYKNNSQVLQKEYGNFLNVKPTQEEQQLSFQLEQQEDCKIKQNKNSENQIVDTYKVKLEQLIQFMAYKYSPNLQTIFQRTFQVDSNTFANIKL